MKCPLPLSVAQGLAHRSGSDGQVRFSLKSDLTAGRCYGPAYVIVTDTHVITADEREVVDMLPLAEIKEARIDELFSSCRLVAVLDGQAKSKPQDKPTDGAEQLGTGEKRLAYYTKAMVPEFGVLCRVINDLKNNRSPELPESDGLIACPRCHQPLPERGAKCPACVPRLAVFFRLLKMIKQYRAKAFLLVVMTVVAVAAQMGPPYFTKRIVDDVIRPRDVSSLWFWIGAMLVCEVCYLAAQCTSGMLSSWLAAKVSADLRSNLHAHLARLRMGYFGKREAGETVSRVMQDTGQLQHFLIDGLPYLFVNSLSIIVIAVILLNLDMRLAILVFLPVPFIVGGVKWFWNKLIPLFHKAGSRYSGLYSVIGESIRGIKAIKAATDESGRAVRFNKTNAELFKTIIRIERNWVGFERGSFWIMSVGVTAVWFFAASRIAGNEPGLTLGDLLAFVGYIWLFYGPLQWFSVVPNWMSQAFASAERIFAVLDTAPEIYEAPDAVAMSQTRGEISFENVHFSYERGKEIIKGIDLHIAPGEMIGLVGKSGAGKSTIINLICRFYDADSGTVRIDGQPIQSLRLHDLRRRIGIVMQEPFIFRSSILENIRYGSPEVNFEDVIRASKAANAHAFIVDKECGYDTVIGEGAEQLSVGEKQRIAIARAILHDPPILILDEATSSVDSETEQAIQDAIAKLVRNRTTIAIAHRLATLRNANRLVVVDEGRIVEIGTHDELIARNGIYAGLAKIQTELSKLRSNVWQE